MTVMSALVGQQPPKDFDDFLVQLHLSLRKIRERPTEYERWPPETVDFFAKALFAANTKRQIILVNNHSQAEESLTAPSSSRPLPAYNLSTNFLRALLDHIAGVTSKSETYQSFTEMIVLADFYTTSMDTYDPVDEPVLVDGALRNVPPLALPSAYATEIHGAVTSCLGLRSRWPFQSHYRGLVSKLDKFRNDLYMLSRQREGQSINIISQSPVASAHIMVLFNARCVEYGNELFNAYNIVPSFLHCYNALVQMKIIHVVPVVESALIHLMKGGPQGIFGGRRPEDRFLRSWEHMMWQRKLVKTEPNHCRPQVRSQSTQAAAQDAND